MITAILALAFALLFAQCNSDESRKEKAEELIKKAPQRT